MKSLRWFVWLQRSPQPVRVAIKISTACPCSLSVDHRCVWTARRLVPLLPCHDPRELSWQWATNGGPHISGEKGICLIKTIIGSFQKSQKFLPSKNVPHDTLAPCPLFASPLHSCTKRYFWGFTSESPFLHIQTLNKPSKQADSPLDPLAYRSAALRWRNTRAEPG